MTQTVTLTIPDALYAPIQRAAEATKQPVEAVLLNVLQTSLPSLAGLPADVQAELVRLEMLDNETLWRVMIETVPVDKQRALEALLARNQSGELSEAEREELAALQKAADLVMLRKARAAVLLRFRGRRLPTLAELRQLGIAA